MQPRHSPLVQSQGSAQGSHCGCPNCPTPHHTSRTHATASRVSARSSLWSHTHSGGRRSAWVTMSRVAALSTPSHSVRGLAATHGQRRDSTE
eukprot:1880003-Rhodomonas_salina.1